MAPPAAHDWEVGMDRTTRIRHLLGHLLWRWASAALLCVATATPAAALPLTLSTSQGSAVLTAGDSLLITGQITNVTGVSLLTTELFLSISGNPIDVLDVTPLLGDPELLIADRTVSPVLDLFQISALPDVIGTQVFDLSILLEDVNGNFAETVTFNVTVQAGGGQVPEPDTLALALLALAPLVARGRPRPSLRQAPG